jgi:hypothetical protein
METLLDTAAMSDVLARSLGGVATPRRVTVERAMYRPRESLRMHYAVDVGGRRHHAVAWIDAATDLRRLIGSPGWRGLAELAAGRTPGGRAVTYDRELRAAISWLPFDDGLPALALPEPALIARLRDAGLGIPDDEPVSVLRYKPGERATLRVNGHVLKAYGSDASFGDAVNGLRALQGLVPVPRLAAQLPALRIVAQTRIAGAKPEPTAELHRIAGTLARELHAAPVAALPRRGPEVELELARRKAELAAHLVPELRRRLERLIATLEWRLPSGYALAAVHGDYAPGQLLVQEDGRFVVLDVDDARMGCAALDLATYAVNDVRGFAGDLETIDETLEALIDGYGGRPPDLEWHVAALLMSKVCHPFRRLRDGWPERVGGMLATAEAALGL